MCRAAASPFLTGCWLESSSLCCIVKPCHILSLALSLSLLHFLSGCEWLFIFGPVGFFSFLCVVFGEIDGRLKMLLTNKKVQKGTAWAPIFCPPLLASAEPFCFSQFQNTPKANLGPGPKNYRQNNCCILGELKQSYSCMLLKPMYYYYCILATTCCPTERSRCIIIITTIICYCSIFLLSPPLSPTS